MAPFFVIFVIIVEDLPAPAGAERLFGFDGS